MSGARGRAELLGRAMAVARNPPPAPAWMCAACGEPVGILGNWLAVVFGTRIHGCDGSRWQAAHSLAVKRWSDAGQDQEPPMTDPIVAAVCADLLARSGVGLRKYGATLEGLSLREALQHAYEEALDAANYLKAAMVRMDAGR